MRKYIPELDDVVEAPRDELALRLLRLIQEQGQGHLMNRNNLGIEGSWAGYGQVDKAFLKAMVEAWDWAEHHGLVAREPGSGSEFAYITKEGERFLSSTDPIALARSASRIEVDLHPLIQTRVRRPTSNRTSSSASGRLTKSSSAAAPSAIVGLPLSSARRKRAYAEPCEVTNYSVRLTAYSYLT
jgi:hypothetical protein